MVSGARLPNTATGPVQYRSRATVASMSVRGLVTKHARIHSRSSLSYPGREAAVDRYSTIRNFFRFQHTSPESESQPRFPPAKVSLIASRSLWTGHFSHHRPFHSTVQASKSRKPNRDISRQANEKNSPWIGGKNAEIIQASTPKQPDALETKLDAPLSPFVQEEEPIQEEDSRTNEVISLTIELYLLTETSGKC